YWFLHGLCLQHLRQRYNRGTKQLASNTTQNRIFHCIPHRGGSFGRNSTPACSVPPARDLRTLTAQPPSAVTPALVSLSRAMGATILGMLTHLRGSLRPVPYIAPAPPL